MVTMIEKEFSLQLLFWYKKYKRDLPWRKTRDPYKIWISEIMLQQTTVNAVIPYFEQWIKRYPTMESLAKAQEKTVLKSWEGLGYYSRVRNIHKASKIMVKDFGGQIPKDPKVLIKLPGFGPYTVGAVLSIAYGLQEPIIDANIRRIVMRLLAMEGKAEASLDAKIQPWINQVLPQKNMSDFNQAFMELGALVCGKQPLCYQCPVKAMCKAYAKGIQEIIPEPKKTQYVDLDVVIGILKKKNKYFIQRRAEKGLLHGLWEFPGGKKDEKETLHEALNREMKEECGVEVLKSKFLMHAKHFYTHHRVKLHVYVCECENYPGKDKDHLWVTLKQMRQYAMPSGSLKIVDKLSEEAVTSE